MAPPDAVAARFGNLIRVALATPLPSAHHTAVAADEPAWRRLYPFESHYLDRRGLRYHYLDEGAGAPIVMVHGNPTWSFYFRELVIALRGTHRCIVPDHIGCGLSDKPGDDRYEYTLERRVEDLEALLDHLGLDHGVTLVLHDWGGMIGLAAALRRPERIARLVLMNTAAFLLPRDARVPLRLRLAHGWHPLASLLVRGLNLFVLGAAHMATAKGLPGDVRAGLIAPYGSWADRIAVLRFVQDIPLKPADRSYALARWTDDNLHRLAGLPTLICWGLRDFVFTETYLDEWRRRFPHAAVHAFPDAGHYVLEDARDEVVHLVSRLLETHRDDAPSPRIAIRGLDSTTSSAAPTATSRSVNVAGYLAQMACSQPQCPAIVWSHRTDAGGRMEYRRWTFAQLEDETNRYAWGLEHVGIARGTRTILMVRSSPQLFALVFALFKVGAVPVLIDPGMGQRRLVDCLHAIQAEAFIGVPIAHALRLLHPSAFRSVRVNVTVGRRWFWRGRRLGDIRAAESQPCEAVAVAPDDPAAIIFTTGSTGPPKGVLYTHGIFDAQIRSIREHFSIQPGEIDLPTFPLFSLFDPALGLTAVIPEMDPTRPAYVDPTKIIRAIRDQQVTNIFGSPALLDRVGRYGAAQGVKLPTLRRVVSAGAPVSPAVLERFAAMLEGSAEIHTPYGATEAMPVASIGSREILGKTRAVSACGGGTCVGRPMPGMDVRILRIGDEPIEAWSNELLAPSGEIGEIVVRGPVVTREYPMDAAATRLAKIRDGETVWHRMGDVGRLDEQGRLWFCGRKAHRVVMEHGTLFTVPCEAIFNQHQRVLRSALVGVGRPPRQRPVICVELQPGDGCCRGPRTRAAKLAGLTHELLALAKQHELTRTIETVLFHPGFPVDIRHNSKIFREKLAIWAERRVRQPFDIAVDD